MNTRTEQLIESWFSNTLSEAEGTELRQLLANDPAAAAEFAWQQSLSRAVRNGGLGNEPLRIKLNELERGFRFRKVMLRMAAVAAAIAVLIVAIWWVNSPGPQRGSDQAGTPVDTIQSLKVNPPEQNPSSAREVSPQENADQDKINAEKEMQRQRDEQAQRRAQRDSLRLDVVANFRHFRNETEFNTAGGVAKEKEMAMNAFMLYDKKEYGQAALAFKPVVEANPADYQNQFYYGVSLLGSQQYETAAKVFRLTAGQESAYQTRAKYYLGLAYTGAGEYKTARQAFQDYLSAPDNRQFKSLAEEMLKILPQQ